MQSLNLVPQPSAHPTWTCSYTGSPRPDLQGKLGLPHSLTEFIISKIVSRRSLPQHSTTLPWFPGSSIWEERERSISYRSALVCNDQQAIFFLQGLWRSYINGGNSHFMLLQMSKVLPSSYSCDCMYWWSVICPLYQFHNVVSSFPLGFAYHSPLSCPKLLIFPLPLVYPPFFLPSVSPLVTQVDLWVLKSKITGNPSTL